MDTHSEELVRRALRYVLLWNTINSCYSLHVLNPRELVGLLAFGEGSGVLDFDATFSDPMDLLSTCSSLLELRNTDTLDFPPEHIIFGHYTVKVRSW